MTNLIPQLEAAGEQSLFDKTGREIMRGDIVKVFHFVGARRKRYFMYKQALGAVCLKEGSSFRYMQFGHLDFGTPYHQLCDGRTLDDYEIIQSIDASFEDRPRKALKAREAGEEG